MASADLERGLLLRRSRRRGAVWDLGVVNDDAFGGALQKVLGNDSRAPFRCRVDFRFSHRSNILVVMNEIPVVRPLLMSRWSFSWP